MKQGMTFEQLVERVEQEAASRRDYYVPTAEMHLMTDATGSRLATPCGQFQVKERAHLHLAELCGIDRRYYQRMRTEAPFLLDRNVNHWLSTNPSKQRIVRALDRSVLEHRPVNHCDVHSAIDPHSSSHSDAQGKDLEARSLEARSLEARAIVSARYAMLDNDALLRTVGPVIQELDLSVESCDVGEERIYIKMVSPRLRGAVQVGDEVQAGLIVRNSEVRCSAVEVDWFIKRLVCTNGMVVTGPNGRGAFRRHVGRDWEASRRKRGHHANSYPSTSTPTFGLIPENTAREEWERAIWEQLQSSLRQSLDTDAFTSLLERLRHTTTLQTRLGPDEVAERVGHAYHLQQREQSAMLYHLANDEDVNHNGVSLWGVLNAVTRTAQDVDDYTRATELEELGGHLAHLSLREWDRLVSPN